MPAIHLTQLQIDWIAEACNAAMDEDARFLEDDVRRILAEALHAMGKPCDGESADEITESADEGREAIPAL